MRFVYHMNNEPAEVLIDGHLLVIQPNELFEVPELRSTDVNNNGPYEYIIPDHQVAKILCEHAWYHGMVEVPTTQTRQNGRIIGVQADIETAKKLAADALMVAEDQLLTGYVNDQQERVTKEGKAALAPSGRVAKIVEKKGIDLKAEFNIDPPGYRVEKLMDRDAEIQELRAQLALLAEQIGSKAKKA